MKVIIIALVGVIIIFVLAKLMPSKSKQNYDLSKYSLKTSIVTPVEKWMYNVIQSELPENFLITPKIGMKDFIDIKKGKDFMRHFTHIAQKHIDFLICEKDTLSPVLGIEIDDSSHQKESRRDRDQSVDEIYNAIGLKVLHIPTKIKEGALRNAIKNELCFMDRSKLKVDLPENIQNNER